MSHKQNTRDSGIGRRDFGRVLGTGALISPGLALGKPMNVPSAGKSKTTGYVRVAFTYPPTEQLDRVGYYSWPGSSFGAENRQRQYTKTLNKFAGDLNLRIEIEPRPLDTAEQAGHFIASVNQAQPDGLLLIPFKKSHVSNVLRILDEVKLPTIVFATMGVLLTPHLRELRQHPSVYLINSLENLDAVRMGLRMIQTARRMRESTIVDITGDKRSRKRVPHLGTEVVNVPLQDFYALFAQTGRTDELNALARTYLKDAVRIVEPTEDDVYEAAKCYFVLKRIVERENAQAVMMTCLPGLKRPHKHVPPCMGFMNLRDEGIPAGCESDLDATLTMMLLQYLFARPAFQHNPSADTEKNLYFGAHCTAPSKMHGPGGPAEPYALRSHAEAGWGCVPQVLFPTGQEVTFTKYHSQAKPPEMLIYSGAIAGCPPSPPCGGCRTNVEVKLAELKDASLVKSHHLCLCYGDHARRLRTFCRMFGINAIA